MAQATLHKTLRGHAESVYCVSFSPDSKLLASASGDKIVRFWDLSNGELNGKELTGHKEKVNSVAFSPDGKSIVTGSKDNTARIWFVATEEQINTITSSDRSNVNSVAWSPKGALIASGSSGRHTVILWDASSGSATKTLTGHTGEVLSVSFSQKSNQLVSGALDKTAIIWNLNSGAASATLAHPDAVCSVCFSHDDKFVVTGCGDHIVRVFNVVTREEKRFEGHTSSVRSVALSFDGSMIASGSSDNSVRLWDVASTKQLQQLDGHTETVRSVAFSGDGEFIASGSDDKTVCLWNAPSFQRQILPSTISPKTNKSETKQQKQQEEAAVSATDPTVAIVTALELELFPFMKWVDPIHEIRDGFSYFTGLLGKTKVVLGQLPSGQTGNVTATAYVLTLLQAFSSIDVLIFCGIAGGLPTRVHLGDVVVSSGQAGVIQWDFTRWIEGQCEVFERTGHYSHLPSAEWLSTVTAFSQAQRTPRDKAAFQKTISDFVAEDSTYARPDVEADRIFRSTFVHSDMKKSCQELGCFDNTDNFRVAGEAELKVVQGSIASGNGVMKSAKMRDALAKIYDNENLLAIEMESAGAACAAHFKHKKYLFVRGICDYADSHKNKQWQNYAALAAAAVVRRLIEMREHA